MLTIVRCQIPFDLCKSILNTRSNRKRQLATNRGGRRQEALAERHEIVWWRSDFVNEALNL